MSFKFDYDKFYNYYTDVSNNCMKDLTNENTKLYFYRNIKNSKPPVTTDLSCHYILIDDVKVYITPVPIKNNIDNKALLFTIPTKIDDKFYDFHYHFGLRALNKEDMYNEIEDIFFISNPNSTQTKTIKNKNKIKPNIELYTTEDSGVKFEEIKEIKELKTSKIKINSHENLIYFHKTIQEKDGNGINMNGKKKHNSCYFQNNLHINKIKHILCINENKKYMKVKYSPIEMYQINEIIKRPFLDTINNNKNKTVSIHRTTHHNTRNIHHNTRKRFKKNNNYIIPKEK